MRQESAYTRRLMTMKNNKKKIAVSVVAAILLVLLYLLIFAFSGQDGEDLGKMCGASECYFRETLDTECDRQYGNLF